MWETAGRLARGVSGCRRCCRNSIAASSDPLKSSKPTPCDRQLVRKGPVIRKPLPLRRCRHFGLSAAPAFQAHRGVWHCLHCPCYCTAAHPQRPHRSQHGARGTPRWPTACSHVLARAKLHNSGTVQSPSMEPAGEPAAPPRQGAALARGGERLGGLAAAFSTARPDNMPMERALWRLQRRRRRMPTAAAWRRRCLARPKRPRHRVLPARHDSQEQCRA